ncbi:MAG: M15 family metallopeptidase [Deltaproteobacteria bacterium]|nr:M15 family metallopeptidase [Deltaproteobacteria bacterium]
MNALVLALALAADPVGSGLVDVHDAVPRAVLEMHYATPDNFLHKAVYAHARCLLRADVAEALNRVEARLEKDGFRLKLWDCYRPLSVQRAMWKLVPVKGLVADPEHGGSHHNRGTAIDASLVDLDGKDIAMPTKHDDFTKAGRRDAACADPKACEHKAKLRAAMEAEGFTTIRTEWWHFDAQGADHAPLLDEPL